MILYHSSFVVVAQPDLLHSRPNVDFGKALSYLLFEGSESYEC